MQVLYEQDVTRDALAGRRVAIIGYGSQGRPQAQNLHDSGIDVVIGLRPDSPTRAQVAEDGLAAMPVPEAVVAADVVMLLLPDERQPAVFATDVAPHLRAGAYLGFAHGFAIHYGKIEPPPTTNVFLVAPKGIGPMVRSQYLAGTGVAALVAVHQDPAGDTRDVACSYACALGSGRTGILETTFREETETDLFGEQVVLCGGLIELIERAFTTLVEAGYAPEMAYLECLHEVKLIADLLQQRGIAGMQRSISRTAAYGGLTRGPRVIGPEVPERLRGILAEIRSGAFAEEWLRAHAAGSPELAAAAQGRRPIDQVGDELRARLGLADR
jgi:ketol-acid reductoisomerase